MSNRTKGSRLWDVRWPDDATLFAGTLEAVVAHMNERHRATGLQHTATEVHLGPKGTQ